MSDEYLNLPGLLRYHTKNKAKFAAKADLDELDAKVDELIAEGGEPNVIEEVKVNGTALPVSQKAVNVPVPTKTSDLTNDGDGQSGFATEAYVEEHGGKIDTIKVNGTAQTIVQKAVDISVPEKVSDLTNDSQFQTASEVATSIEEALENGSDPYQTASDVDAKIAEEVTHTFRYKGSVATVADLPASGNEVGDVYDVLDTGVNHAWDGTRWDPLGTAVDLSLYWGKAELTAITNAQIDALFE